MACRPVDLRSTSADERFLLLMQPTERNRRGPGTAGPVCLELTTARRIGRRRIWRLPPASRRQGRMAAAAQALVEDGAGLLLSAPHEATAAAAVARLTQNAPAGAAAWAVADNTDPAALGQLVTAAKDRFGRLDGALISVGGSPAGTIAAATDWPGSSPSAWPARTEAAAVPRPPPSLGRAAPSPSCSPPGGRRPWRFCGFFPTAGGNGRSEYERRRPAVTPAATPSTTATSRDRIDP
jgi:hypothetical protein